MTKNERLQWCQQCANRAFNLQKGTYCGLTQQPPDFEGHCPSFMEDAKAAAKLAARQQARELTEAEVSKGIRVANYVIDFVVRTLLAWLIGFGLGVLNVVLYGNDLGAGILPYLDVLWVRYLLGIVISFAYYFAMESATGGRTIGKLLTSTVAITETGEPLTTTHALGRSLWRQVPFNALSFLGQGPGWHDSFTKTRVVHKRFLQERIEL
ncbi:MAG: RDD family protein [Bernardetiaceae bacterium]|jgi:uncharacterized RDD family membrane protein YckC|nr:RDD family protein [Bernardetiaceae bacterium]